MKRILPLAILLISGCIGSVEPADLVVASYPAAFVAEQLAGDDLIVADLSSGVHGFEPSARDLDQLRQSTHLVLWDEALESWAHQAEHSLGSSAPQVIEISALPEGEEHIEMDGESEHDGHGHGDLHHDPHTWNDPLAMHASVVLLAEYLVAEYPEYSAGIAERSEALRNRLTNLHNDMSAGLANCTRNIIVTNHEAYNYLAHRYEFGLHALHGIEPGSEPSPQSVNEAIQKIKELGLPVIFIEEGTDKNALRAIQDETNVEVRVLKTSEVRPATGDYIDSQYHNLAQLEAALGCS